MKLKSLYKFNLGNQIQNKCIDIGKYDGKTTSITYATIGGKIIIYSTSSQPSASVSQSKSQSQSTDIILSLNKEITCICYGKGEVKSNKSYLFIGSPSSLMCYDIIENRTVYNNEVENGVYCLLSGIFSTFTSPLVIVGGNCSLQGFDITGEEQFWTVTGGNTSSLAFNDVDDDSFNEVIVGTDDYMIRYIKKEQNINELAEVNKVSMLFSISNNKFIYSLDNGVVGVYYREKRQWFYKGNTSVTSILSCDINKDNKNEIVVGWSNGRVTIHIEDNGDILEELSFGVFISRIFYENISDGIGSNTYNNNQLIICLSNGDVLGYDLEEDETIPIQSQNQNQSEEMVKYQRMLNEKKILLSQIEKCMIESTNRKKINSNKTENTLTDDVEVQIDLQSNNKDKCADLLIKVSKKQLKIKQVIILSEQLYPGGSYVQNGVEDSNEMIVKITNKKDMKINLHIKVLVGISLYSPDFQVFEFSKIIPKYCFYIILRDIENDYNEELSQGVVFNMNLRRERFIIWIEEQFNIHRDELQNYIIGDSYDVRFMSLRTDKVLQLFMKEKENEIRILTDEIELAGNIFQDLNACFKIEHMDSYIAYPEQVGIFEELIESIKNLDSKRNGFNINISDIIGNIKELYVRAEDSRLLDNINDYIGYFNRINLKNQEILSEYHLRTDIYDRLIRDLKGLNEMIQLFANLKYGSYRNKFITFCRQCLKDKNYQLLISKLQSN